MFNYIYSYLYITNFDIHKENTISTMMLPPHYNKARNFDECDISENDQLKKYNIITNDDDFEEFISESSQCDDSRRKSLRSNDFLIINSMRKSSQSNESLRNSNNSIPESNELFNVNFHQKCISESSKENNDSPIRLTKNKKIYNHYNGIKQNGCKYNKSQNEINCKVISKYNYLK